MVAVMEVELVTFTLLNLTPGGPETVAPGANPLPISRTASEEPSLATAGVMLVSRGAAMTRKHSSQVLEPDGPLTVTLRVPSVAVGRAVARASMVLLAMKVIVDSLTPLPDREIVVVAVNPAP